MKHILVLFILSITQALSILRQSSINTPLVTHATLNQPTFFNQHFKSINHNSTDHIHLKTLNSQESTQPYYWTVEIGYAWLNGLRPWIYWANTTECFDRLSNFTYAEVPKFKDYLALNEGNTYN
jgi:hypothetical protein